MYKEHFLSSRVRASIMSLMFMNDPAFRNGISCRKLSCLIGLRPQPMRDILIELRENDFVSYGTLSPGSFSIKDHLRGKSLGDLIRLMDQGIRVGNHTSKDPLLIRGTAYSYLNSKEQKLQSALELFLDSIPLYQMVLYGNRTEYTPDPMRVPRASEFPSVAFAFSNRSVSKNITEPIF